jgi:hypothetical protein
MALIVKDKSKYFSMRLWPVASWKKTLTVKVAKNIREGHKGNARRGADEKWLLRKRKAENKCSPLS